MQNITKDGTEATPAVDFDFQANVFALSGMAYMEDADRFFEPLIQGLRSHLDGLDGATVRFDCAFEYFNSSSARAIFRFFLLLDEAAAAGNTVTINWHIGDDEDLGEQGEELAEDLEHANFVVQERRS